MKKKGPWLFRVKVGDEIPICMVIITNHFKDPYQTTSIMESKAGFCVAQLKLYSILLEFPQDDVN